MHALTDSPNLLQHGSSGDSQGASLSIRNVSRRFVSRDRTILEALHDVSLELAGGEFVSIVGPSGCGKSTLLMLAAGLSAPTTGQVAIDGEVVTAPMRVMGIAFQRDSLLEWRTALDNVLAQATLRGWKRQNWTQRAQELLEMAGLAGFERKYPRELSGGMRQRVSLCRALLHDPRLLLLDEPFGAVDAMTREQLNLDVGQICARSAVTTLLVTHDINEAVFMANRVVVMTPRPGCVAGIVSLAEPVPRGRHFRTTSAFLNATIEVRELLEAHQGLSEVRSPGDVGRSDV